MSDTNTSPAGNRMVTGFFDTRQHAEAAKTDLAAVGIPGEAVTIVGNSSGQFTVPDDHQMGFWESLTNMFMPDEDRRSYAEGLRRGGFALSVHTTEALYKQAIDVLDRDGAVDLDEREMSWEAEGWSRSQGGIDNVSADATYRPADSSTAGFGGSYAGEDGISPVPEAVNPDVRERIGAGSASQVTPVAQGGPHTYVNAATPADDTIADGAENRSGTASAGGRRDTSSRSRVRSYVVDPGVGR